VELDLDAFKDGQRRVWSAGDYADVARTIESAAHVLLERVGAAPGEDLLDVATGSGNVAIPAALGGVNVTGLDITPKLLEVAAARAAEAGAEVRWLQGDAEQLPFADRSFDRVTSCFGVIFAPRHRVAASELARVARPGGTIAVTGWTPEGLTGRFFSTASSYMPPPPPGLQPPVLWGREDHVRELFGGTGAELTCERHGVTFTHASPESWFDYQAETVGPMVLARAALEPQGRWEELRTEMIELYSAQNEARDGSFSARSEYLVTLARLPGG
jgi:SAM-dependent methyltransferase